VRPQPRGATDERPALRLIFAIPLPPYSLGKDGQLGKGGSFKASDDISTWQ